MDITLKKILAWLFGVFFILGGLGSMAESIAAGIIILLVGLFLIPNIRQEIADRYEVQFSTWVVVLIAIIGLGAYGALMPLDDSPETQQQTNGEAEEPEPTGEQTEEETTEETEEEQETRTTHQLNEEFTVGDITYSITDHQIRDIIGGQFTQEQASGEYVIIDVEVTNNADEPVFFSDSNILLIDEQDREYSQDSMATITHERDGFSFEELQPGLTESGIIVYDVPVNHEERYIQVNPVGLFSNEDPEYVKLE